MSDQTCQCCIVGAGPAGMILSLLLARKGVSVKLLEMHSDLDRDFRGDTVHASTLEMLDQIGLAEGALELPHARIQEMAITTPTKVVRLVNFKRLKTKFPYVAMMPQELFLNYLLGIARRYQTFEILFASTVTGLCRDSENKVVGVEVKRGSDRLVITCPLVVAADGRFSKIRRMAGFTATDQSPTMDVAWIRVPRRKGDQDSFAGFYMADGNLCILLSRPDTWQIGYVFPKGNFGQLREKGIEYLRTSLRRTVPWLDDRVLAISDFKDVHVLKIKSDRLDTWYSEGLLLIGDAAHVMSPAGGVGINFAIADAVEAANVLTNTLLQNSVSLADLAEVQKRRFKPTETIQNIQALMIKNLLARALGNKDFDLPLIVRFLLRIPFIRDIPAKMIAFGPRPARIEDP